MIPFVFIFDKNLISQFIYTCRSIQKYLTCDYKFLIITDSNENIPNIEKELLTITDTDHYIIKTPTDSDKVLFSSIYFVEGRSDINSLNYIQISIPEYFPEFEYLFFMEPDQILKKDIVSIWEKLIADNVGIGIVPYGNGGNTAKTLKKIYPHRTINYIYNCGVVFYNCNYWREHRCREKCIDAIIKQKEMKGEYYNYYSEGAINIALQELITPIDARLNVCNLGYDISINRSVLNSAIILHWNGLQKPWKADGLYKEFYRID